MPHPLLGLPPTDATAGRPEGAARLRASRSRVATLALDAALRLDPTLRERHDEIALRRMLRDYDRHIEQLARALESGEERFVVEFGETIVPIYRRRHVRMNDLVTLINGLREAALATLPSDDADRVDELVARWTARFRRHARLPGDHAGNRAVRFIWKGAGLGDDTVV